MDSPLMRTAEQARAMIELQGVSLSEWSRARGFEVSAVRRVLQGKASGNFGNGHRIKVALGMKPAYRTEAELVIYAAEKEKAAKKKAKAA